ncbi:hypothetical protein ACFXKV_10145 [Streptomyces globisporus]|uniref:hypothetical protein n=1 Tax=Streptomyces globisporus TaxID=1908 RepID=UPI0034615BE7|nr:hypothetical protein OG838_03040 [Streptomyces globisporus]
MTLDAMDWVWKHSQSKGNTRVALLYMADQVRTSAAEARLGRPELMAAMNATKNTVRDAIADALELGELEIVQPSAGRRAALYRLPRAVGYSRKGSDVDPLENGRGSKVDPLRGEDPSGRGSDVDPLESVEGQVSTPRGSKVDPLPHPSKTLASSEPEKLDGFQICQPLVQAMTEAGITVSWSMKAADWLDIATVVQRAGVPAMVAFARDAKAAAKQKPRYATFFLRGGWRGLPPAASVPPPRATPAGKRPHCGHPDCDPITRTREIENDRGLRNLHPCPDCHPTAKGQAA